jgi:hypothetical protein
MSQRVPTRLFRILYQHESASFRRRHVATDRNAATPLSHHRAAPPAIVARRGT